MGGDRRFVLSTACCLCRHLVGGVCLVGGGMLLSGTAMELKAMFGISINKKLQFHSTFDNIPECCFPLLLPAPQC